MPNAALVPSLASEVPALRAVVDGYPETMHRLITRISRTPLETGAAVTDHAVAEPPNVVLTGLKSNLTDEHDGGPARAWEAIQRLHEEVTPLTVITGWATYTEMLIARVTGNQLGKGLRFRMELQKILRSGVPAGGLAMADVIGGPGEERLSDVARGRVTPQVVDTATDAVQAGTIPTRDIGLGPLDAVMPAPVAQQFDRPNLERTFRVSPERVRAIAVLADRIGVPGIRRMTGFQRAVDGGNWGSAAQWVLGSHYGSLRPDDARQIAGVLNAGSGVLDLPALPTGVF